MAARGWDQTGHESDKVVVHLGWLAKGGGGRTHHLRDQSVGLFEGGRGVLESVSAYAVESFIVYDHGGITVVGQPLQSEQHVVGLHHHVRGVLVVREDRVSLHQLLGEVV